MNKKNDDPLDKEIDFSKGERGPVVDGGTIKLPVTIRLDGKIIDHFKNKADEINSKSKQGENSKSKAKYQSLINDALLEYIQGQSIQKILLSDEFAGHLARSIKKNG